jgi:hypothetical protein
VDVFGVEQLTSVTVRRDNQIFGNVATGLCTEKGKNRSTAISPVIVLRA